jgi:putative PIN family toxin of toxin-antitoxin system
VPRALVRAVVDTNILVRGILRRREAAAVRVFDSLVRGDFQPLISDYILSEVTKTLQEPEVRALRRLEDNEIDAIVGALRDVCEFVPGDYQDLEKVPRDLKDRPIVAAGIEGGAHFLVTDDRRDLLPLKVILLAGYRPLQIVTPGDFLRHLGAH